MTITILAIWLLLCGVSILVGTVLYLGLSLQADWEDAERRRKNGLLEEAEGTEEDLLERLHAAGVHVSADEIADWGAEDFDQAWGYARAMERQEDGAVSFYRAHPPIPRCLLRVRTEERRRWSDERAL